ncbi:MAG: hypothetical protein HY590_03510 [Candidatus Omnitrophica bacterium]|nr:hypothetical protein [Candidatus Omnitrophota bacterium]
MSKKLNTLGNIWLDAYDLIRKTPRLLLPLSIVAFLEALWLEILCFSLQPPLKTFFLPPIKRFFGEFSLHYPAFLFIVPSLFGYAQLLIYIFVGGILTAVTIVMAASLSEGHPLTFGAAWKKVRKRLFALILVSLFIVFLLGFVSGREVSFLRAGFEFAGRGFLRKALEFLTKSFRYLNFLIAVAIQTLVLFIFPCLVLENKKFFRALGEGIVFGGRHFGRVFLLLLFPALCYSPIWFLKGRSAFLVQRTLQPEAIVWLLGVGIVATLLVDTFIAVSVTLFFLRIRHEKSA